MKTFILSTLAVVTILFYLLKSSFESFSRISLAKFLKSIEGRSRFKFDYLEKYDLVWSSLGAFVFFLQAILLVSTFMALAPAIPNPLHRLVALLIAFIAFFNLLLAFIAYINKEFLLKSLIFLFPAVWFIFYPVNKLLSFFLKNGGAGEERESEAEDPSEEELEVFFEEGAKEGVLKEEDQEMIESVLEFGNTLVKEVMTPRVDMAYVNIDATLDELVSVIRQKKKSRFPVIHRKIDNIEGILLAKDVFNYWPAGEFDLRAIIRPPLFIPETMRILELLKEMQRQKQKFAIVIDEFGGVSGVVTMEDIIEEIVGDIKDEYDEDSEAIVKENDHFLVRGNTDIYQLCKTLEMEMDETEDFQTVAGLISFKLGKIPQLGDKIAIEGRIFEVVELDRHRIKKVKIYREHR